MIVLIMGVCGSGKTTVGKALADKLNWSFADADDFHSDENIRKMNKGQPLTDGDRWPWLLTLHGFLKSSTAEGRNVVVTCSALKQVYRQVLVQGRVPGTQRTPSDSSASYNHLNTVSLTPTETNQPSSGSTTLANYSTSESMSDPNFTRDTLIDLHENVSLVKSGKTGLENTSASMQQNSINNIKLIYLKGSREVLQIRMRDRREHFMPVTLLDSQLDILEEPTSAEEPIVVDINQSIENLVQDIVINLKL